jgi:succinylglutamate desuccinylase
MSPENRIEDFVRFVRSKVNNVARFRQAERSVRRYADQNINVLFGGRPKRSSRQRRRKTVKKCKSNRARKTRRH